MKAPSRRLPGIGSHHSATVQTDDWLTPPHILAALGDFDLDPCSSMASPANGGRSPDDRRRRPALALEGPGLAQPSVLPGGVVDGAHGRARRGTALVFARTETRWWAESVWPHASAILFLFGRLTFHHPGGMASTTGHNSGGPSALIAYGEADAVALQCSRLPGALVRNIDVTPRERRRSAESPLPES